MRGGVGRTTAVVWVRHRIRKGDVERDGECSMCHITFEALVVLEP